MIACIDANRCEEDPRRHGLPPWQSDEMHVAAGAPMAAQNYTIFLGICRLSLVS